MVGHSVVSFAGVAEDFDHLLWSYNSAFQFGIGFLGRSIFVWSGLENVFNGGGVPPSFAISQIGSFNIIVIVPSNIKYIFAQCFVGDLRRMEESYNL